MGDGDSAGRRSRKLCENTSNSKELIKELIKCRKTGAKFKYDVKDDEMIYEFVDDDEYEKIVNKRKKNDWVVNDLMNEYYDPGFELHELVNDVGSRKIESTLKSSKYSTENIKDSKHEDIAKLLKNLKKKESIKTLSSTCDQSDTLLESILQKIDNKKDTQLSNLLSAPSLSSNSSFLEKKIDNDLVVEASSQPNTSSFVDNLKNTNNNLQVFPSNFLDSANEASLVLNDDMDIDFDTKLFNAEENMEIRSLWKDAILSTEKDHKIQAAEFELSYEDNEKIYMYYLDAVEDHSKKSTEVYIFGKCLCHETKKFVSCCVSVKYIPRKIYLLPCIQKNLEEKVGIEKYSDVLEEFKIIANSHDIFDFSTKLVQKRYCFNDEIPELAEYIEISYQTKSDVLLKNIKGKAFSHILSSDMTCLELLLLEKSIKGPCWLSFSCQKNHKGIPFSWCRKEWVVYDYTTIEVCSEKNRVPPLICVSLLIESDNHDKNQPKINSVTLLSNEIFIDEKSQSFSPILSSYCAIHKPKNSSIPIGFYEWTIKNNIAVDLVNNEHVLLNIIASKLIQIDPDIINGFDIIGKGIVLWLDRSKSLINANWSKLGRLRFLKIPKTFRSKDYLKIFPGRIFVDLKIICKEIFRLPNYEMADLSSYILNDERINSFRIDERPLIQIFLKLESLQNHVNNLLNYAVLMSMIINKAQIFQLFFQITVICGGILSHTFSGGKSERNEFLLMHSFFSKNYICPDRSRVLEKDKTFLKGPKYEGGLVLEPLIGYYDTIILLIDFKSLYPSIIQEYNICFSKQNESFETPSPVTDGVLPLEIKKLVDRRKAIKSMLLNESNSSNINEMEIRQKALKLIANSMYGCLGTVGNRFSCTKLASFITLNGRNILKKTQSLVESLGFEVIYGDTDSLMINTQITDIDEALEIEKKIRSEINNLHRCLEIECDAIYKPLLLLKKKKYAAVPIKIINGVIKRGKQEIKGIELVRRDWSVISKECSQKILDFLLSDQNREEIIDSIFSYLNLVKSDIDAGTINVEKFVINKMLTKSPKDYSDAKSLPHVTVALRCEQTLGKKYIGGDIIKYLICEDGTDSAPMQRAYSVDELNNNNYLKIDINYYVSCQIFPVISRICAPIAEIERDKIAAILGLSQSSITQTPIYDNKEILKYSKNENIEKLLIKCLNKKCSCYDQLFCSELILSENMGSFSCSSCNQQYSVDQIFNQFALLIRKKCKEYYNSPFICSDCSSTFNWLPLNFSFVNKCPDCQSGTVLRNFDEKTAYLQILYLKNFFCLIEKQFLRNSSGMKIIDELLDYTLSKCGFGRIDFSTIFKS